MKTAGIIGGSNLLGNYVTLKFLEEDFRVKVQISEKEKIKNDSVFKRITAHRNLEVCPVELTNPEQINSFIKDCEVIIHCGEPFRLNINSSEIPVFVPITRNTQFLFNAVKNSSSLCKVIFITSAMAFNQGNTIEMGQNISHAKKIQRKNPAVEKARFHAEKAVSNILDNYPKEFFKVVYISPVEVDNGTLSNSKNSTSSGLQYLFSEKITSDVYFEKLLKRQVLDRLTNINELPDMIFQAATKKPESPVTIDNVQLPVPVVI